MSISRRIFIVLAAGLLWATALTATNAAPSAPANHTDFCGSGTGGGTWKGEDFSFSGLLGASGEIEGQAMTLCAGYANDPASASWVWVGVTSASASCDPFPAICQIIQIGIGKCHEASSISYCNPSNNPRADILGYWYACSGVPIRISDAVFGQTREFSVEKGTQYWQVKIDDVVKANCSPSWTPARAEYFAETWDHGDAMGGPSSDHHRLWGAQYKNASGWHNTAFLPDPCTVGSTSSYPFYCDEIYNTEVQFWTSR
jgi:hypothetical protein